ncbi:MAG: hypothetical protein NVSMB24_36380 [Mucilaginibacter sp.]
MKNLIFVFSIITAVLLTTVNVQAQNRPMSSQAKGAIIGGAGGAILGGLLGHNVTGALLGAAVGAGGGYIIGNEHRRNVEKRNAAYQQGYDNGYYTSARNNYHSSRAYQTAYRSPYHRVRYAHNSYGSY